MTRILGWFRVLTLAGLTAALPATAQVLKVACIGDSITEGAGVDNPTVNAYPIVLGRLLGTNYQTRNFGVSGRTLLRKGDYPYWNEAAFRHATNYKPDIVTIKLALCSPAASLRFSPPWVIASGVLCRRITAGHPERHKSTAPGDGIRPTGGCRPRALMRRHF
jgi:hypothetical protein